MNNRNLLYALALCCILLSLGAWVLAFFHYSAPVRQIPAAQVLPTLQPAPAADLKYAPPRPQNAPEDLREAVMLGYNIINDTAQYAPDHVGNELSCATCHLEGGTSKGSISLVGAAATYPRFSASHGTSIDLAQKVQDCFARNLNASPGARQPRNAGRACVSAMDFKRYSRVRQFALGTASKAGQHAQARCRSR